MNVRRITFTLLGVAMGLTLSLSSARAGVEKPPLAHPLTGQAPDKTYVVTSTADSGDNTNAAPGTFRRALVDANNHAGFDAIRFDLSGSGVKTIVVKNYFPDIADDSGVMIDGTQSDDKIQIDGSQTQGHHGLRITSNNNVVKGLVINGVKDGAGISIEGGDNNVLSGNFIGTDPSGTSAKGNHSAILLNNAHNNTIGGTEGVTPGGACTGDCNLLAGNRFHGIVLDAGSSNNRVWGNLIGLNRQGTAVLYNTEDGILVADSPNNLIGGDTPQKRNVISGNRVVDIELGLDGSHGNVVQGNWIGFNSAGSALVAPSNVGIMVGVSAHNNLLDANVVGGHHDYGILVFMDAASNEIRNNRLGISPFGDNNFGFGIRAIEIISNGNNIHHNRIANSANGGVRIKSGMNNRISQNQIFNNTNLGIGVDTDAFTDNDPGDGDGGANGRQNFPVLTRASNNNGTLTIQGTLNSRPNQDFIVELFYNNACGNAFGRPVGEGLAYLASAAVRTDGSGNGSFSVNIGNSPDNGVITSTATDSQNNTSEFSFCRGIEIDNTTPTPGKPSLVAPGNGATTSENPPLLDWGATDNTTYYRVLIRYDWKKGPWAHRNKNVGTDSYRPPQLQGNRTYFWRVLACNSTKCAKSGWSSFKTP